MTPDAELVLVWAPRGRDATLACQLLTRHGVRAIECPAFGELLTRVTEAGCAVITADAMTPAMRQALVTALASQPPWSDFPIVLFARHNTERADALAAMQLLGNVTILERPVHPGTLVSAVFAALRGRRRQYQAREAIVRRDQFLAMLGHELRNPLGAIVLALETMAGHGDEATVKKRTIIERQARHLSRLVDDLLDVARVTSGKIQLHREPLDLREVIQRCVHGAELAARARSITLSARPVPASMIVDGDLVRLEEVFSNLIANAIKYSPDFARVEVAARTEDDEHVIDVIDTGIGMTPALADQVFELFAQADATLARSQGGLGIGLTLARSLVELHGGSIAAHSEGPGRGSRFRVRLPVCASTAVRPSTPRIETVEVPRDLSVVLVEDNLDLLELTRDLLADAGCTVTTASDGPSGLAQILHTRPDLAFVDIGLPGLDGYDVVKRVRETSARAPFLVAMTGYGQPEDTERALAAGFDLHLTKPVTTAALQMAISACQHAQHGDAGPLVVT